MPPKVQRVAVDGIVGPATWSRLDSPYVPRARYDSSAASVEINLTWRVLYLTQSGAITRISRHLPRQAPDGGSVCGPWARGRTAGGVLGWVIGSRRVEAVMSRRSVAGEPSG